MFESGELPITPATLLMGLPAWAVGIAWMMNDVLLMPGAKQVTVPPAPGSEHLESDNADTKLTPTGKISVTVTSVGPL